MNAANECIGNCRRYTTRLWNASDRNQYSSSSVFSYDSLHLLAYWEQVLFWCTSEMMKINFLWGQIWSLELLSVKSPIQLIHGLSMRLDGTSLFIFTDSLQTLPRKKKAPRTSANKKSTSALRFLLDIETSKNNIYFFLSSLLDLYFCPNQLWLGGSIRRPKQAQILRSKHADPPGVKNTTTPGPPGAKCVTVFKKELNVAQNDRFRWRHSRCDPSSVLDLIQC